MRMIARPWWEPSVEKVASAGCACASIPMERRCRTTCTATPRKTPPVIRMSGKATTASSGITTRCVTARRNGHGMMMAMASGRSIPTLLKACGRAHVISCARFGASTKNICTAIWPCVNIKSISNASVPHLSLGSLPSTDQLHEPILIIGVNMTERSNQL